MALQDLTQADLDWIRKKSKAMIAVHESEFLKMADPSLMKAFYRGRNKKWEENENTDERGFYNKREHYLTLSRIFTATNTLGPQLYYQNPQPIVVPGKNGTKEGAAFMASALRGNMEKNEAERQNPEACLSGWFFGLGWKKVGMRNTFLKRQEEPETAGIEGDETQNTPTDTNAIEGTRSDYILDRQSIFNDTESPENVQLDDKAYLHNGKFRQHRVKRSLFDLMNSSAYDAGIVSQIYDKFKYDKGTRLDAREIEVWLNEMECKQPNGMWVCSWVDEFPKALRYDRTIYEDFNLIPLVFTNEPFCRYPVAHMKVASQVQEHLDYMATLYIRIIDRVRNQIIVDKTALAPGMEKALLANKHGGVIFTNKPISSQTYAQLTSAAVQNDLPNLMSVVQQNLTEILGGDEQLVGGQSKNKTLGQDELARIGTKVRETGMQDKVRKWMIVQFKHEAKLMQKNHVGEMDLTIKPRDYSDASLPRDTQDQYMSFGTQENPSTFKDAVPGEYNYDMNVYEAIKPDKQALQEEYTAGIELFSNPIVRDAMLEHGTVARIDKLAEGFAENFEFIRSKDFVEVLDPAQQAALQVKRLMMQGKAGQPKTQMAGKKESAPNKSGVEQGSSMAANL